MFTETYFYLNLLFFLKEKEFLASLAHLCQVALILSITVSINMKYLGQMLY